MTRTFAGAVLVVLLAACSGESVLSLEVGQCAQLPDQSGGSVSSLETVECDQAHDAEVYHLFDLPDGEFPGAAGVQEQASTGCLEAFEGYTGTPFEESPLQFSALTPTEEGWGRGDQEVVCYLFDPSGELTGSQAA